MFGTLRLVGFLAGQQPDVVRSVPEQSRGLYVELVKLQRADDGLWFVSNGMRIHDAFTRLAELMHLEITLARDIDRQRQIVIEAHGVALRDLLVSLAEYYDLTFEVTGPNAFTVAPRMPLAR